MEAEMTFQPQSIFSKYQKKEQQEKMSICQEALPPVTRSVRKSNYGLAVAVIWSFAVILALICWYLRDNSVVVALSSNNKEAVESSFVGKNVDSFSSVSSGKMAHVFLSSGSDAWQRDEIAVNALVIGVDQSRHLQEELDSNAGLPEEDRSILLPKAGTLRAVDGGQVLLQ